MDKASFEQLFRNNYGKAYYLALRILHDDEASKDVVADAFELVWRRLQDSDVDKLSSYLLTAVKMSVSTISESKTSVVDMYRRVYRQ